METFFLVFHLIVAVAMIAVILLQRSEGGGMGFGSDTMGGAMTARGTANFLTRLTAILAAVFIGVSLFLSILASQRVKQKILSSVKPTRQIEQKVLAAQEKQPENQKPSNPKP